MLELYDSRTAQRAPLLPARADRLGLYVCGVTVYDECHLGHARMLVVYDVLVRHLRASGRSVHYVRNITDVDDKIIRRAREMGIPPSELSARMIDAFGRDTRALGLLPADAEPRATAHVGAMIEVIARLLERGFAYRATNGDVYYDVSRFPTYGALTHRRPEDLRAGARVEIGEAKDDPLDFALWKAARPDEPSWEAPWGPGRPGWHIECSAMSTSLLGVPIDLHGGGEDLKFPHHENEIAQSDAAFGTEVVRRWMHNGFVQVGHEKMAKSLGNFLTIREALERYGAESLRLWILQGHYRQPLLFDEEKLVLARQARARLRGAFRAAPPDPQSREPADANSWRGRFTAALDDDLNTPEALAVLFDLVRRIHRDAAEEPAAARRDVLLLRRLGERLGLFADDPSTRPRPLADAEVEERIARRRRAREERKFAEADQIRAALLEVGVILEDGPEGTRWYWSDGL
jgi:cysteinyl-tRNA synthetase